MSDANPSPEALSSALKEAERGIRLNYGVIAVIAGVQALILGTALKIADFSNATHTLVVLAAAFIWAQFIFMLEILTNRQNAVNARVLYSLQLLDERSSRE